MELTGGRLLYLFLLVGSVDPSVDGHQPTSHQLADVSELTTILSHVQDDVLMNKILNKLPLKSLLELARIQVSDQIIPGLEQAYLMESVSSHLAMAIAALPESAFSTREDPLQALQVCFDGAFVPVSPCQEFAGTRDARLKLQGAILNYFHSKSQVPEAEFARRLSIWIRSLRFAAKIKSVRCLESLLQRSSL